MNDYGAEGLNAKSDAFYALVKGLREKGVPLHGVGLQFHLEAQYPPDWGAVAKNLERLRALGVEVQVTELDVRIQGVPSPQTARRASASSTSSRGTTPAGRGRGSAS